MSGYIRVGDTGSALIVTVTDDDGAVDVSSATVTKQIILKAPDGSVSTFDATFTTDGTDGKIQYGLTAGDIDQSGVWEYQGRVVITAGDFMTTISQFVVEGNLLVRS